MMQCWNFVEVRYSSTGLKTTSLKFHELKTKKWAGRILWEEIGNQRISFGAENTCPKNAHYVLRKYQKCPQVLKKYQKCPHLCEGANL